MHDHLQSSMPLGSFPVFWCENCEEHKGSIILHYYSIRGALLGGVVVGITKEVAKTYFDVEVKMDKINTQGEEGSECTTWRISAVDPEKKNKLTQELSDDHSVVKSTIHRRRHRRATLQRSNLSSSVGRDSDSLGGESDATPSVASTSSVSFAEPFGQCPFSSMMKSEEYMDKLKKAKLLSRSASTESLQKLAGQAKLARRSSSQSLVRLVKEEKKQEEEEEKTVPARSRRHSTEDITEEEYKFMFSGMPSVTENEPQTCPYSPIRSNSNGNEISPQNGKKMKVRVPSEYKHGLTSSSVRKIFPYHVVSEHIYH